jgi:hypothetical protein
MLEAAVDLVELIARPFRPLLGDRPGACRIARFPFRALEAPFGLCQLGTGVLKSFRTRRVRPLGRR